MKSFLLLFLLIFPSWNTSSGQLNSSFEKQRGDLFFEFKSISFVRNKEYFNPDSPGMVLIGYMYQPNQLFWYPGYGFVNPNIEGYTLIGNFIQPSVIYYPYSNLSIRLGAHILNYSGAGKLSQIKPVISTTLSFSEKTSFTLGSLEGCENRKLFDPLFDFERIYTNNSENGFEFITEQNHFTSDTWLDWEHFIFTGDTDREIINFGESFKYTSDKIRNRFDFNVPLQFLIRHKGGQISNYPESLETYLNLAAGININYDLNNGNNRKLGIDYFHFMYYDNSANNQVLSFKQGYADWFRLHYNSKIMWIDLAYWKSHNFYAPVGNLVYSSISGFMGKTLLPDRSLLSSSMNLTIVRLKYLELFFGVDFYYDLNLQEFYNAAALHIRFNEMIKLLSLKK